MPGYGGKELANAFRTVRKNTIQVAEDIPEDKYSFTPAEGARSVEQALAHIAVSTRMWQEAHDLYVAINVPAGVAESAARLALLAHHQGDLPRSRECLIEASAAAHAAADLETLEYIREVTAQLER